MRSLRFGVPARPARLPSPAALLAAVVDRIDPGRFRGRRVWRSGNRLYISVPGTGHLRGSALARAAERALRRHPAVEWAVVNAALGAAVVCCHGEAPVEEFIDLLEAVDAAHRGPGRPEPPAPHASADDALGRTVSAIVADLAGLSVGGVARLLRVARIPAELAALVTAVDVQPALRSRLEQALGAERADVVLGVTNAVTQAMAQGTSGLAVDLLRRVLQLGEAQARRSAWRASEPDLVTGPGQAAAAAAVSRRPVPLPPGPVERYSRRMGVMGLGAMAATLGVTADPARAGAVALSSLPKAAAMGREGFAAALGRMLASRGVLLMDPRALRRLDRIDTVVLDADVLTTGRFMLGELVPLDHSPADQLGAAVHSLFRPDAPGEPRRGGGFELRPMPEPPADGPARRARATLLAGGASQVLALAGDGRIQAVVGVVPEPAAAADGLVAAARRAGLAVVLAGPTGAPGRATVTGTADRTVAGAAQLTASLRQLQVEGRGVLLVSWRRPALAAADCGVGVAGRDGRPAWGAHVLVGSDLTSAAVLIDAAGVAAQVSRRSVNAARVGAALGAAVSLGGRPGGSRRLSGRALLAVDGVAAVALAGGAWAVADLARRPVIPPVSPVPWHTMPTRAVLDWLDSRSDGLSAEEARQRRRAGDPRRGAPPTLARAFLDELANPLTPILAGGAALSASLGAVTDAGIIVGVTALSALLGAAQRVSTERAVAGLLEGSATSARVYRDGKLTTLPSEDVVVGDVLAVEPGDVVPADCRVLTAAALEVDESTLTGESLPVTKDTRPVAHGEVAERRSMLYEGTTVAAGGGNGVVVATGAATEAGRGMAAAQAAVPVGGVEARLAQITRTTLPITLGAAGAVVLAGLVRGHRARDTVGAGVALAVAAVPEGLPFLVSAAQLAAARRLSRRGALVRDPKSVEALGRVDVLCFDKTGTLTEGRIALRSVSDGQREHPLDRSSGGPDGRIRAVLAAGLRSTPQPVAARPLSHPTDRAVLRGAAEAGVDRTDGRPGWQPVESLPFEPTRGYHATLGQVDGGALLSVKGAPEQVIPRCVDWYGQPLDQAGRAALVAETTRLARRGYRVLAVAERSGRDAQGLADRDVTDLSFLGFLLFADQVRATSAQSVRDLWDAGVQVIMITGDHPDTAAAIAAQLGLTGRGAMVTGAELDRLDDEALAVRAPDIAVVARGTPAHKVRVVRALQQRGRTVAMTGDGANDAAAIRLADVGIALGRRGTPAARAAADLVVTDDRVETILAALTEGRTMWASVRRALGILVGGNLGEIAFTVLGAGATGMSPLSPRQLLLVNLLTDLAPAMAVALRPPQAATSAALLSEGPETSLGEALTAEVAVRATATAAGATGAWLVARFTGRRRRAGTVALVGLVGTQLGQTLLAGGRSWSVLGAAAGSAAVLGLVVQTPGVSQFFGCTPLGPLGWATGCGAAAASTVGTVLLTRVLGPGPGR